MSFRRTDLVHLRVLLLWGCVAAGACAPMQRAGTASAAAGQAPRAGTAAPVVPAPPKSTLPTAKGSVKFLVIGDSGTGGREQNQVAVKIAEAHKRFPFDFAIMLGDNLYGSENASAYVTKFERPYKPLLDAGVKFYAALGNHDEPSQRNYAKFNMDQKRFYKHTHGDADFFVLDSTYMTPQQIEWLEDELEESDAKWKIPYMHHPMYSSGEKHGSERDLQLLVEPLFLKHGVDVVFAGHEHFYERLKPQKGIVYITQGGAAKLRKGNLRDNSLMTARGFDTDRSFTLIEIHEDHMFFETISRLGQIVDSGVITRRELNETPASQ
jgi:predicted phosphodiesterase